MSESIWGNTTYTTQPAEESMDRLVTAMGDSSIGPTTSVPNDGTETLNPDQYYELVSKYEFQPARPFQTVSGFRVFRRTLYVVFPARGLTAFNEWNALVVEDRKMWHELARVECRELRTARSTKGKAIGSKAERNKARTNGRKHTVAKDPLLELSGAMKKMEIRQAKVARAVAAAPPQAAALPTHNLDAAAVNPEDMEVGSAAQVFLEPAATVAPGIELYGEYGYMA